MTDVRFCSACGKEQPREATKFCPYCGAQLHAPAPEPESPATDTPRADTPTPTTPMPTQQPSSAGSVSSTVGATADRAVATAQAVAGSARRKLDEFAESSEVMAKVPGRSLTLVGLGVLLLAIGLGIFKRFPDVGLIWSVVLVAGGALVAVQELRRAGTQLPDLSLLPAQAAHPMVPVGYTLLVIAWTIVMMDIAFVPLLWVVAAFLLAFDQLRKASLRFGGRMSIANLRAGDRRWIAIACLVAVVFTFASWSDNPGYTYGGYEYGYDSYSGESGYEYNPSLYYMSGFSFPGRSLRLAALGIAFVLALLVWASFDAWRSPWARRAPYLLAVATAVWWIQANGRDAAAFLFLVAVVVATYFAHRSLRSPRSGATSD